jgi:hypothetical protein
VTFAPILKQDEFPLAEISGLLLDVGAQSMNRPVEIEFAVKLTPNEQGNAEFAFLQMRPFVLNQETENLCQEDFESKDLVCASHNVLGSGREEDIRDIVVVDRETFDRAASRKVAQEVAHLNQKLVASQTPYLLVGVGRWGASDPWLGIPVDWEQIAGARVIVESGFKELEVAPSQGSHFFQNLAASGVGYFTVGNHQSKEFLDWSWLREQPQVEATQYVRHVKLERPLLVRMDGRKSCGLIYKPERS